MGITHIKILVTDAFLYSLGNFQHFILWFYVLCPVISNVVLRFCQKASLCASHLLQVNSTMMNLGISISPVIGWYKSMQSSNTKKKKINEGNMLQKISWFKYFMKTDILLHILTRRKIRMREYDYVLPKIAVPGLKIKGLKSVCMQLLSAKRT